MEDLNKQVLELALKAGICDDWAKQIPYMDKMGLMKMYLDGIDFSLGTGFLSNDFLKKEAGDLINKYGIYIDQGFKSINPAKLVLLGSCKSDALISDFTVSQIFVKDDSIANIDSVDNCFTVIDCFDNSNVTVLAQNNSKVLVNLYGKAKCNGVQKHNAIIKVVNKFKDNY